VGAENLQNNLTKSTLATWYSVLFGIAAYSTYFVNASVMTTT
jgi:hypothetical protein